MRVGRLCGNASLRSICGFAFAFAMSAASAQGVDTVLFNGKVMTVDADFSVREALAIADGKVFSVGAFTVQNARIVECDFLVDPDRIAHLDLRVLDD